MGSAASQRPLKQSQGEEKKKKKEKRKARHVPPEVAPPYTPPGMQLLAFALGCFI